MGFITGDSSNLLHNHAAHTAVTAQSIDTATRTQAPMHKLRGMKALLLQKLHMTVAGFRIAF